MLSRTHDPACDVSSCSELELSNKGIVAIAEGTFDGMTRLQGLDLSGNRFESLPEHVFRDLTRLEKMRLGGNSIGNISQGAFSTLSSLTSLDLNSNKLTQISDGTFQGLGPSLMDLHLSSNGLTSISSKAFQSMSGLKYISLIYNQLVVLPRGLFANTSLTDVSSNFNPLMCVIEKMLTYSYQSLGPGPSLGPTSSRDLPLCPYEVRRQASKCCSSSSQMARTVVLV